MKTTKDLINKFSNINLEILNSKKDYADEVKFKFENNGEIKKVHLFIDIETETAEEKVEKYLNTMLKLAKPQKLTLEKVMNDNKDLDEPAAKIYLNVLRARALGLDVEDWEHISDEELEMYEAEKPSDTSSSFNQVSKPSKAHYNWMKVMQTI